MSVLQPRTPTAVTEQCNIFTSKKNCFISQLSKKAHLCGKPLLLDLSKKGLHTWTQASFGKWRKHHLQMAFYLLLSKESVFAPGTTARHTSFCFGD